MLPDLTFRGNLIYGMNQGALKGSSCITYETGAKHRSETDPHEHVQGPYRTVIEDNLFAYSPDRMAIRLGKGAIIMRDITIRRNIFTGYKGESGGVFVSSPQRNLRIEDNIFYKCGGAITAADKRQSATKTRGGRDVQFGIKTAPASSMTIRNNIFCANGKDFSPAIANPWATDRIKLANNHFVTSSDAGRTMAFKDPAALDFRDGNKSQQVNAGVYRAGRPVPEGTDWWRYDREYLDHPERFYRPVQVTPGL
jgi:hypothetical protein